MKTKWPCGSKRLKGEEHGPTFSCPRVENQKWADLGHTRAGSGVSANWCAHHASMENVDPQESASSATRTGWSASLQAKVSSPRAIQPSVRRSLE